MRGPGQDPNPTFAGIEGSRSTAKATGYADVYPQLPAEKEPLNT
jgi:hypothetical protein